MAQVFNASLSALLPEEPAIMASRAAALIAAWAEMLDKLKGNGVEAQFGISETRAKAVTPATGAKRGRPRKTPANGGAVTEVGGQIA